MADDTADGRPVMPFKASPAANHAYWCMRTDSKPPAEAGRRQIGWKIGFTSEAARTQMKASEPMFGALFADMKIETGSAIPVSELIEPRLEPEIAFVMKHDVTAPAPSKSEILRAIDYARPALEIIDRRSRDWKTTGILARINS